MFVGAGTVLNVGTILAGSALGVVLGHRLPQRTRDGVTDVLGLVTLLVAGLNAAAVVDPELEATVGRGSPLLIVLGAVLVGGITGSLLRIEERLESVGGLVQDRVSRRRRGGGHVARIRFIEGFVSASLVFCVGPLTVLGTLSDGLGRGIDELVLKATLDGFASIAFAASLGWGVAASALSVAAVQATLTAVGIVLGEVLRPAHLAALTATGGLLLVGVALRLLRIKAVPVGDLLPALIAAPLLVEIVVRLR